MSRIAGFFHTNGHEAPPERLLGGMLAALPGTQREVESIRKAALGWSGQAPGAGGGAGVQDGLIGVIDGRILNLVQHGRELGTQDGDVNTLLAMYQSYGFVELMNRLHGDFAIAVFDVGRGRLFLGRDRLGVKPLYYAHTSSGLAFSSQPRALLTLSEVSSEVNHGFVARYAGSHYRTFDNFPEESPYQDIRQLPAASVFTFDDDGSSSLETYWKLSEQDDWQEDEETLAEHYRELLFNAVSRRVSASKNPAFTLSGGLDSSSVLCSAEVTTSRKCHAFSSIYTDESFDERDEIQDVVAEKVERWEPIELSDHLDVFALIERLVRIHDEPVATATWLSHLTLCDRVAESGFDALFGGLGGDELNAGEYEYFPMYFADLLGNGERETLDREIEAWVRHHDHPIHRKTADVAWELIERLTDSSRPGRCLPDLARLRKYAHVVRPEYQDLSAFTPSMDAPFYSYLKNRTYQDMFKETLPCCLRAEDRQCTAAGMTHFDPFLDHELIEFMYRVSGSMKIGDGITKRLLRKAMRGVLPEATRTRIKKTGWNAPAHRWFSGKNLDALRDLVKSRRFVERGIYNEQTVNAIIDDHVRIVETGAMEENHMMFLWQLVNLEMWLRSLDEARQTSRT